MNRRLFFCTLIALLGAPLTVAAQKLPPKKLAQAVAKTAVLRPTRGAVAAMTTGMSDKQLEQAILKLQRETAALERQLAKQQAMQEKSYSAARKAVFRALGPQLQDMTLSGTLFKTTYNGQEEIFGVVPMHVLRNVDHVPGTLSYKFTAGVFTDTTVKFIPAWVVQLSSAKTGDVALVKFRKQDEKLLSPLALSIHPPTFPQQAYSQGFARNLITRQSFQLVGTTSAGLFTAKIPAAHPGDRSGYCGSPVVDDQQLLTGIHIGSDYIAQDPQRTALLGAFTLNRPDVQGGDIGYVVPASFLENLVAAYHNERIKPIAVRIAGHEITHLSVNEYVSRIELLDKDQRIVWFKDTDFKVSFSAVETVLRLQDNVASIRLEIGQTHWTKDDQGWHIQNTPGVFSVSYPLPGADK